MRSIKLYSLVLTLIISFTVSSIAEPVGTTGKISGKVTDTKTSTPIVGAIIKVDGTNLGAESDATGDYVILNVPVGTYTVRCTYLGYESLVQTDVRVSAAITTTLNFAMSEKVTLTDTVEIIAKRNAISQDQSGRNITEEEIKNTG